MTGPPPATVVVVAGPGSRPAAEALEALDRHGPPGLDVVLVDDAVLFGAAANLGMARARSPHVVVMTAQVLVQPGWLAPLLAALEGPSVGAVVPRAVSPAGHLLAAGAVVGGDGRARPLGWGTRPGAPDHRFRHDTDGTTAGCLLLVARAVAAVGGFDARAAGFGEASVELALRLLAGGYRTVLEPASLVVDGQPDRNVGGVVVDRAIAPLAGRPSLAELERHPHHLVSARDAGCPDRVLVVHSRVPRRSGTPTELRVARLLDELQALWPSNRVTLLAVDAYPAEADLAPLLGAGVEVATGGRDWDRWFDHRRGHYSHVVLTEVRASATLDKALVRTQPQAVRVLCTGVIDFRAVHALGPLPVSPADRAGLRSVEERARHRFAVAVERAGAVWCADDDDRRLAQGLRPGLACRVLPIVADADDEQPRDFVERTGVMVVGTPEADALAAHTDAVLTAAGDLMPLLRRRHPALELRVLCDEPSPVVQQLAGPGTEIVRPQGDEVGWLGRARVCLAPYPHGVGGRWTLARAIAAATPFVTTSRGAEGTELGDLHRLLVSDDPLELAERAWELHEDKELWLRAHEGLYELTTTRYGPGPYRRALIAGAAEVGMAPPRAARPPTATRVARHEPTPQLRPRRVPARRDEPVDYDPFRPPAPRPDVTEDEAYRRWASRHGPTPARLTALRMRLAEAPSRPRISIVTPVYNTDPPVLEAAIRSVVDQVYEDWELCLADDCSPRDDTRAVLERSSADPRIKVSFLAQNRGIAGATDAALEMATGEFVAFFDHDDLLKPHALAMNVLRLNEEPDLDLLYSDEDKLDLDGRLITAFLKADWSPDELTSRNYMPHFLVVRRTLLDAVGGLRLGYDGSQDHDLILRLTERTDRIGHVAEPLYTWRGVEGSAALVVDAKPYAFAAAKRALDDALRRRGRAGTAVDGILKGTYRTKYELVGRPLVSIIIPTRDRLPILKVCIESVLERSTYPNYEIVVVDNQSERPETLEYLSSFPGRVVRYDHAFSYGRMMNLAALEAAGEMFLFLNNDTEVIAPDWVEAMLEHAQRPEVGAVGGRLVYPDGQVQHEGIVVGLMGVANNVAHDDFWGNGEIVRNTSAVTGALTMIRPSVYWEVGGHEERMRVAFSDVDLCLRIRQAGYEIVYTPYARLTHHEGATRRGHQPPEDGPFFSSRWLPWDYADPYYNANLDTERPFKIKL